METDEILYWFIRIFLVLGLVVAIGMLIGMYREAFVRTHNTETRIMVNAVARLLDKETITPTSFNPSMVGDVTLPEESAIKAQVFDEKTTSLGELYLKKDYYEKYEPLAWAEQWNTVDLRLLALIDDAGQRKLGILTIRGVYKVG
jgi:hypothetical protein